MLNEAFVESIIVLPLKPKGNASDMIFYLHSETETFIESIVGQYHNGI